MEEWYDKEQIICVVCRHKWILLSNQEITDLQHNIWINYVISQHKLIIEEKGK